MIEVLLKVFKGLKVWFGRVMEKYVMFLLFFIIILREGIEVILFVFVVFFFVFVMVILLFMVFGLVVGGFVGYFIYK